MTRQSAQHRKSLVGLLCVASSLLSACGGGGGQDTAPQSQQMASVQMDVASQDSIRGGERPAPAGGSIFTITGYTGLPLTNTLDGETTNPAIAAAQSRSVLYVAPNGNDKNLGTEAAPFRTLTHAVQEVKPGTTVYVAPGRYEGGIRSLASGTKDARIVFMSTARGGAVIVPPAESKTDVAWDNRGSYVDIVGFQVDGLDHKQGRVWTHGIYNGGSYVSIRSNHISDIAKSAPCTSAGGSAIGIDSYYNGVGSEVVGNHVHDIGAPGCRFVQGIYVSTSGTVKNNLAYRVSGAAIHLWHDAHDVKIVNNTTTTSGFGIIVGGGNFYHSSAGADNIAVHNNIVYDNTYGISEQGKTGVHNAYRNNLVNQNATYNISLKNGLSAVGTISSAPLLAGYSRTAEKPNFHLTSSSPAVGRGVAALAPSADLDGAPRNPSAGYDVGAYQY